MERNDSCAHDWRRHKLSTVGNACHWIFGGEKCALCGEFRIEYSDVQNSIADAFDRGYSEGKNKGYFDCQEILGIKNVNDFAAVINSGKK